MSPVTADTPSPADRPVVAVLDPMPATSRQVIADIFGGEFTIRQADDDSAAAKRQVAADASGAPAEPLYARVARRASGWGPGGTVGLVVGATAPAELEKIRAIAPELALLVPGVGAQGGEVEPVLRHGPAVAPPAGERQGGGLLVNVSRGIAAAAAVRLALSANPRSPSGGL